MKDAADTKKKLSFTLFIKPQGTLKSLLQHHSSKALILRRSAFFTVQLSHTTKSHSLD